MKTRKVRFNVVNFIKKRLMFLDGVRPVGFSMKSHHSKSEEQQESTKGWHTIGSNIAYKKSYISREIQGPKGSAPTFKNYYTLSFDVEFPHDDDSYYIAMNYPYTYSAMMSFVDRVVQNQPKSLYLFV